MRTKQTKTRRTNAAVQHHHVVTPELYTPDQLCQGYAKGLGVRLILDAIKDGNHPLPHYRLNQKTILIAISDFREWLKRYYVPKGSEIEQLVDEICNELK